MEEDGEIDISEINSNQQHSSVILHLDIDYFYAQVEETLNPGLKNKPVGIKQNRHIVTCNYVAREYGIGKMNTIQESLEKCPELVIINGEDLTNYKVYSKRVSELLHKMFGKTERMGLDEHFIDVTKEIEKQLSEMSVEEQQKIRFVGPLFPDEESFSRCKCGCRKKLIIGTQIAQKVRNRLLEDLKLTCSIGIAHNKLLAKLVGSMNKPDNQTALAPVGSKDFMADLKNLRSITGIGEKTAARIQELGIQTIGDLQNCDIQLLQKKFGLDMAMRLKELSLGNDSSDIRPSGKPKTVGLEDSFKPISIRGDAAEKFQALLSRLMIQIQDDGRIPQSIKVTVRKYDLLKKNSIRETKQCALAPSLFRVADGKIQLTEGAEDKIMKNILILFDRMVDLKQQFNITLLGLCFSKFQEQKKGPGSIANYLMKKQDVEVQSITNLSNETINGSFNDSFRSKTASPSSSIMDFETLSNNSLDLSGSSETELEPSPKKRKKLNLLLAARRRYSSIDSDIASPSKLNVSDLHLNGSCSMETSTPGRLISPLCKNSVEPVACSSTKQAEIPPNIDPTVWQELPLEVQRELMMNWQTTSNAPSTSIPSNHHSKTRLSSTKTNNNTLHKYFIQNS